MRPCLRMLSVAALALATSACATASPTASSAPTASPTLATASPTVAPTIGPSIPPVIFPPSSTPAATPTVEPTPSPTPSVPSSPNPTAGAIDHPTEARAVILRVEQVGGFVIQGFVFARVPAFTLYGDGTVIYRPMDPNAVFGDTFPVLSVAHMDEDQVQALLRFALGQGRLLDARAQYLNPFIVDAPDTVFTLNAGELSKKVTVQGMGVGNVPPGDAQDVAGFQILNELLNDFGKPVANGQATTVGPYTPTGYRGQLFPADGIAGAKPWPWLEITSPDLITGNEFGGLLVELTPDQVSKLTPVPTGGLVGAPLIGPDNKTYQLSIKPLLPDDQPLVEG